MSSPIQLVWFKRDLRVQDHLPLVEAMQRGRALALYIFEPSIMAAPDYAVQHACFAQECLLELEQALAALGLRLWVFHSEALAVLSALKVALGTFDLRSHEETGNGLTFKRDQSISAWCKVNQIAWSETPSHGVVRRLRNRDHWSKEWERRMSSPVLECPKRLTELGGAQPSTAQFDLNDCQSITGYLASITDLPLSVEQDKPQRMKGGRSPAISLLHSFLNDRAINYRRSMSSPTSAAQACSRLSPYIAMGTISVREVMTQIWTTRTELLKNPQRKTSAATVNTFLASLKAFESRLHWRCHFVQKLESQPSLEFKNQHSAYNALRQEPFDPILFAAWANGNTGFPMIDACMKMLLATGWINFRMRAMLVSFSSYQLWQHWREPALHLARQFLDYEPGIHYSQCQMQSGTTGINTIRMYNPVKQARDQDPNGEFVRRWLPALAQVPDQWIFEPWNMPLIIQRESQCEIGRHYPAPIIDLVKASRHARDLVWAVRDQKPFAQEAQAVFQKLGSRNPARERRKTPAVKTDQLDLF
jgi:deoxyribodipyrimidine photo-lyase